jgi:hypothetical protein
VRRSHEMAPRGLIRMVLILALAPGCGAAAPRLHGDAEGDRRVADLLADARERAAPAPTCAPLPVETWAPDPLLQIHEASTCRYRVTWLGWSPPRDYDYVPDAEGWVRDYFIQGAHGWVLWNLRTGDVVVRPVEGQPLDESGARDVAAWAAATNFPGLDPTRTRFVPTPVDGATE